MDRADASLAAFLGALICSPSTPAVGRAIAHGVLADFPVDLLAIYGVHSSGLSLITSFGFLPWQRRRLQEIDRAALLLEAEVLRSGTEQDVPGIDVITRFPFARALQLPESGEYLALPLLHEAQVVGVISVHHGDLSNRRGELRMLLGAAGAAVTLWLRAGTVSTENETMAPPLRITDRQRRVIAGLRSGQTNAAIAAELGFALGTIKADITAISALLGARGRQDLLQRAAAANL